MSTGITRTQAAVAGGIAVVAAAAITVSLSLTNGAAQPAQPRSSRRGRQAAGREAHRLLRRPVGAAYVADAGFDGFTAINTANCAVIHTYNVGASSVPGDPGKLNFASTDEGIAIHGSTLYFADTGNSSIAIVNSATLNPKNVSPAETDINTGTFPQDLAVSPDGTQLWVANTGPQTQPDSPTSVSVINTATNKVTATIRTKGAPSQIAFSPDGTRAYVVTADGLSTFSTNTLSRTGFTPGLGDPRSVAVAPDGTLYVTDTNGDSVKALSPRRTGQGDDRRRRPAVGRRRHRRRQDRLRRQPRLQQRVGDRHGVEHGHFHGERAR